MNMAKIHTSPLASSEPKSAATRIRRSWENYMFTNIFRAKNIYESVLPVFIFTSIAGLTPYYFVSSAGVTKVKISYVRLIWSLFIISVICVCSTILREPKRTMTVVLFGDSFIHATGDLFQLIASTSTSFINITLTIFRRKSFANVLVAFTEVDEMFESLGIVTTYQTLQALLCFFAICQFFETVVAIGGLVFIVQQGDSLPDYSFVLICFTSIFISIAVVYIFFVYILLLTRRFERLNGALGCTEMTMNESSHTILSLRRIHSSLCDIADLINGCFNIQILIIIGINFITTLFHFFYILEGVGSSKKDDTAYIFIIFCFGICVTQFINFMLISLNCTRCKFKAQAYMCFCHNSLLSDIVGQHIENIHRFCVMFKALDTAAVVHKLLNVDKIDEDVKDKIIGSLTTYLIILTQFATSPVTPPLDF